MSKHVVNFIRPSITTMLIVIRIALPMYVFMQVGYIPV